MTHTYVHICMYLYIYKDMNNANIHINTFKHEFRQEKYAKEIIIKFCLQ